MRTSSSRLLLLLLAASFGLSGALLLWPQADSPAPVLPAAATGLDEELQAVTPVGSDDAVDAGPRAEAATAEAGNERRELQLPAATAPPAGATVVVLTGRPPQPVGGVGVAFIDRAVAHRLRTRSGRDLGEWDLPRAFGSVLHTDAQGRVQLPSVTGVTLVSAAHDGQFAFASFGPDHRGLVRLLLQTDETLHLAVRDSAGAPAAAVPIAVYQGRGFDKARRLWRGDSRRDGTAEVLHFQLLRQQRRTGDRFCAVVPLPLAEPVATPFDGRAAVDEVVVLQLPPTTALAVTLVDATAEPLLHPATIVLTAVRSKQWNVDLPIDRGFDQLRLHKPAGAAALLFGPLGRQLPLRATVQLADDRRSWPAPEISSAAEGDTTPLQIRLPDDYAVLAGRLVDGEGRAVARELRAELALQQAPFARSGVYTCADGRFDLPVRLRAPLSGAVLTLRADGEAEGSRSLGARIDLPVLQPMQRGELGDVVLLPLPPLCSGDVVDDAGAAVANASIRVQVFGQRQGKPAWFDAALSGTQTDADGRFAVVDDTPTGLWRIRAQAPGHLPATSPELPTAPGLRLVLMRLGTVRGRVAVPRWLPMSAASLQFVRQFEPGGNTAVKLQRRDGEFVVRNLTPGPYQVQVRLRNLPQPVLSFDGVMVQPGEQRPPALSGIDLDSLVSRFLLHAVGPDGQPMTQLDAPILARYDGRDAQPRQVGFRWHHGSAELITDAALVELTLFGTGLLPRTVVLAPGEHNVYLQPLFPAVIRLPGARQWCGFGRKVRVSMICTEPTGYPQSLSGVDARSGKPFSFQRWDLGNSGGAWLGDGDVVEVPLSRNGKYEVVLRLYGDGGRGQVSVRVGVTDVVLDGPAPSERTLQLDAAAIAAAIARLEQRPGNRRGR